MKKLVSLVVLGALVLAACGSGSNVVAATVDETDVKVGEIDSLMDLDGATATKEDFARFLTFQIQWLIVNAAAEGDFGIVISDEDAAAEADSLYEEFAEEGESREDFVSSRGFTEVFLQNIARQRLIDTALREEFTDDVAEPTQEEIDAARDDAILAGTSVCASHILVETEEEAQDILTRLEDGDDFGELAVELSTDTGSGANNGELGCVSPSQYVGPFAEAVMAAPIGEVYSEIVESEYGFHVILVTERTEPAEEDIPADADLIDALKEQALGVMIEEWFLTSLANADVSVVEEYGTWVPTPPTGPAVTPPAS